MNFVVVDLMVGFLGELFLIISYLVLKNSYNELVNNFMIVVGLVFILMMVVLSCIIYNFILERYFFLEMFLWWEKLFIGLFGKFSICCIWSFVLFIVFFLIFIGKVDMIKLFYFGFFVFVVIVVIGLYMCMFIIIWKFNKMFFI